MDSVWTVLAKPFLYLVHPGERIYWQYLLVAGLIAYWQYRRQTTPGPGNRIQGFWRYLAPKGLYTHPSARVDYRFFVINTILFALVLLPLLAGIAPGVAMAVQAVLEDWHLPGKGLLAQQTGIGSLLAITILMALVLDFAIFLAHWLQHKIPWLWEFHKVHHSAEVLTPITVYRMHPVDDILTFSLGGALTGLANGLLFYLFDGTHLLITLYGLNLLFFVHYLLGYNLRHSHLWLCYGPFWSRVLISPAQHQIHHSADPRHLDKNFGFIFAGWDALFGSLYIPRERENFPLGINSPDHARFNSVGRLYWQPVANILASLRQRHLAAPVAVAAVALALLYWGSFWQSNANGTREALLTAHPDRAATSVFLEDLTAPEVAERIRTGTTTVIIPTGGTEQNGPHLLLGKHNRVVSHTAEAIARRLGKTLVAPVIAYVPEGRIDPPSDHMRFSGTLSLPEPVFEQLLEHTARSLDAHGFTTICLIGDSAGNQAAQARVAQKLNTAWKTRGVRVIHVHRYYDPERQARWLVTQGIQSQDIGGHAGIRDTSELLFVNAAGVRRQQLGRHHQDFEQTGADGDSRQATAALGRQLLELKIRAAVQQIRTYQPPQSQQKL